MNDTPAARKRRFRVWLTISELVGLLALVIAGLNFWDSHRQRMQDQKREVAADHAASARYAFVMSSQMEADGARLTFQAVEPVQAIQGQRYLFPRAVLDHAMEVSAAKPQIDLDWIAAGLRGEVALARKAGASADGEASIPVGVITTYVQDGDVRSDQSIYRLGYAWRARLLGGTRLALQGVSLLHRGLQGDLRPAVETAFRRQTGRSSGG